MKLLLIRHGKAEDHDASKWPDDSQRPLSDQGVEQFRIAAKQLGEILIPDVLLSSPYVRAVQTAEILREVAGWPEPELSDEIVHGDYARLVDHHLQSGTGLLATVGHEPTISEYISGLITGGRHAYVRVRPGTAALLKLESAGSGTLQWLAPTQIFR